MTDRRTFLALLGVAAATTAVGTCSASSDGDAAEGTDTDETEGDPADALLAYVVSLYGDRLDQEDLEVVRSGIEGSLESGAAFRDVGLENADEPAYGFHPYRGDRA